MAAFGAAVLLGLVLAAPVGAQQRGLLVATTTSTEDTGLLNVLGAEFKKASGIELRWIATGTGKALKLGEDCNVDALLVHDPEAEQKFVEAEFGVNRREIFYNDFVLVGPGHDPAAVRGKRIREALEAIRAKKAPFISRGDRSGTHAMEKRLWESIGASVPEQERWYLQAGQGMMATLHLAADKKGYTLSDRGTYLQYERVMKGAPPLEILLEGEEGLINLYSVIAVNPARCPRARFDPASQFISWIAGPEGKRVIREFRLAGKPLFTPVAD